MKLPGMTAERSVGPASRTYRSFRPYGATMTDAYGLPAAVLPAQLAEDAELEVEDGMLLNGDEDYEEEEDEEENGDEVGTGAEADNHAEMDPGRGRVEA